jgi:uncharacterized protein (DUF1697 family)
VASYVALFRGLNVGGRVAPMTELRALFEVAGATNVKSYIQSGNIVYTAPARSAAKLPARIEALFSRRFGFESVVVVRSAEEFQAAIAANPFVGREANLAALHVMFLAHVPAANAVAALDPMRSPPDTYVVRGREVYLNLPNGAGNSKLSNAYFDAKLRTTSTIRNWNTVLKLGELLAG